MSSADFRQIAIKGRAGKSERLFRAAVSAYCSLTRPSRREVAALDDLALPLLGSVSPEAKRFAAAALSECHAAPPALVRHLADEPVAVSAPLLIRSRALGDVDLIRLIGRHGLPHARAIARRPKLDPAIGQLLDALKDPEIIRLRGRAARPELTVVAQAAPSPKAADGTAAEAARERLRATMRPAAKASPPEANVLEPSPADALEPPPASTLFPALRRTALAGHPPLFQTALADALDLDFETAQSIAGPDGSSDLTVALRALDLSEEQAFMLAAAVVPSAFDGSEAIRLFLHRYRLIGRKAALERVDGWRSRSGHDQAERQADAPANQSLPASARRAKAG